MQMMDIHRAIQWFKESCDLMVAARENLQSHAQDESNVLKRELIVGQRALVRAILDGSSRVSGAISRQIILEQPLLMGHGEEFSALIKAQARYGAENNETWSLWNKTVPVNETTPANPQAREPGNPLASTAVTISTADDSSSSMPSEAPVDAAHIIVEGNDNQTTDRI
jgi:hypothetical protein